MITTVRISFHVCLFSVLVTSSVLLLGSSKVLAQGNSSTSTEPAVILYVNRLEDIKSDVQQLMESVGFGSMMPLVQVWLGLLPESVDRTRPVLAFANWKKDESPVPIAGVLMIPAVNADQLMTDLQTRGLIRLGKKDKGGWSLTASGIPLLAKQYREWIVFAESEEGFAVLPSDPVSVANRLASRYDLACSVNPQKMPSYLRERLEAQIAAQMSSQSTANMKSEIEASLENAFNRFALQSAKDADQFIVGISVDRKQKATSVEIGLRYIETSPVANWISAQSNVKWPTRELKIDNEASRASVRWLVPKEILSIIQEQMKAENGVLLPNSPNFTEEQIKELRSHLSNIVQAMLQSETVDVQTISSSNSQGGIFCFSIPNAKTECEKFVNSMKRMFDEKPSLGEVTLISSPASAMSIHRFKLKSTTPELRTAFPEDIDLYLGTTLTTCCIVVDKNGQKILEELMATPVTFKTNNEIVLQRFHFDAFFGQMIRNSARFANLDQKPDVQAATSSDGLQISVRAVKRGIVVRAEVEDGAIEWFAKNGEHLSRFGAVSPPAASR